MKLLIFAMIIVVLSMVWVFPKPTYKDEVEDIAEERWSELGFEVVGYDGFTWGAIGMFGYGGAKVWYVLKRKGDSSDIIYGGYLQKWGDEYHMYHLQAYDAIKPWGRK